MGKPFFPPISVYPSRVTTKPWIYAYRREELGLLNEEQSESDDSFDGSADGESEKFENEKLPKIGMWLLFRDNVRVCEVKGMTELDYAWQFVKRLVESGVLYRAKCSTAWNREYGGTAQGSTDGVICCYTKDYSDKWDVKNAADAIRKVYYYPRDMYYKTNTVTTYVGKCRVKADNFSPIYKHTTANEMIGIDDIVECIRFPLDSVYPSRVTTEPWLYAYRRKELDLLDEEQSKPGDSSGDQESENSTNEKLSKGGKWLLFRDNVHVCEARGMTELDYAWQFVKRLVDDGDLYVAKCSTAWKEGYEGAEPASPDGVICCYTKDYSDKQDVKKAADVIRKVYYYPRDMYYKTDVDTHARKYRVKGDKFVSIYKHTTANEMFERDDIVKYVWHLVESV